MENKKTIILLLILFATTQILGVIYQSTLFRIEGETKPQFIKQESEFLDPARETYWPLIVFATVFVFAIVFYTFLFRLNMAARALKFFIFFIAIFSFFMIISSLFFWLDVLLSEIILLPHSLIVIVRSILNLTVFLSVLVVAVLILKGRYQGIIRPMLGVTLCAMTGAAIASYFTLKTILVLLFILSIYDFVFVKKTKHIPKLVTLLDKHNVLLTMDIGPKRSMDTSSKEPVELDEKEDDKTKVKLVGRRLGFGDLIFATGLAVATYVDKNVMAAIIMVFFTTLSLGGFLEYLQRTNNTKPQPAIPPIFVGGLVGAIFVILLI